jgi:hypothetical protein
MVALHFRLGDQAQGHPDIARQYRGRRIGWGHNQLEAVAAAVEASAEAFPPDRREFASRLRAVIAANPELREREALKRASFVVAMTAALQERGVPDPTANLAAELGVLAINGAFARWADSTNERQFGELARQSLQELQTATVSLS